MPPEQSYVQPAEFNHAQNQMKRRKIIAGIIGLGLLLVVLSVVVALLGGKDYDEELTEVTARQAEALRIIEEYGDNASSQSTRVLVTSSFAVFTSDNNELASHGISPSEEQISSAAINGIDDVMQDAALSSRFDQTVTDYIEDVIVQNRTVVEAAAAEIDQAELKAALQTMLENYDNLL